MSSNLYGFREITAQIGRRAHPDGLANRIAQAGVFVSLSNDPNAKVDLNVLVANLILLSGQIESDSPPSRSELEETVKRCVIEAGYNEEWGYDISKVPIIIGVNGQSPHLTNAVVNGRAGDTITKIGFATDENKKYLPLPHLLARDIAEKIDDTFISGRLKWLGPDGKVNVAVVYNGNQPIYVSKVVVAAQHSKGMNATELEEFREFIKLVVLDSLQEWYDPSKTQIFINPAGPFVYGSPFFDNGFKGEKDADYMYGDIVGKIGGSAYGKDGSKVDLHASLSSRQGALSVIESKLAKIVEVRLGYILGRDGQEDELLTFEINSRGTGKLPDRDLKSILLANLQLRPIEVIQNLGLRNPLYYPAMAKYFFGSPAFPWERALKLKY